MQEINVQVLGDGTEVVTISEDARRRFELERARAEVLMVMAAPRVAHLAGTPMTDEQLSEAVERGVTLHLKKHWPGMPLFGGLDVSSA